MNCMNLLYKEAEGEQLNYEELYKTRTKQARHLYRKNKDLENKYKIVNRNYEDLQTRHENQISGLNSRLDRRKKAHGVLKDKYIKQGNIKGALGLGLGAAAGIGGTAYYMNRRNNQEDEY